MERAEKHRVFSKLFLIRSTWKNVLYIHIPFCLQRCRFCIYFSKVPERRDEIIRFVEDDLFRQIDEYSDVLSTAQFSEIYLGGGTPTIVPAASLARLFRRIPNFAAIELKAIEASPRTVRDEHLRLLAEHGFRYVSIGLQTFDSATLKRENRELTDIANVKAAVDELQSAGIIVNIDLICFLSTGTEADLAQAESDVRRVIDEIGPASITIHSNYNAEKTREKQLAVIRLVRAALGQSTSYVCTNSLLLDEDAHKDAQVAAEYRLMRRDVRDFSFYLLAKVPQALRFGYNVLGLGEYDAFKVRSNFFGISDFYPRYARADVLAAARSTESDLIDVRRHLGIAHRRLQDLDEFFPNAAEHTAYMRILRAEGFPKPILRQRTS